MYARRDSRQSRSKEKRHERGWGTKTEPQGDGQAGSRDDQAPVRAPGVCRRSQPGAPVLGPHPEQGREQEGLKGEALEGVRIRQSTDADDPFFRDLEIETTWE